MKLDELKDAKTRCDVISLIKDGDDIAYTVKELSDLSGYTPQHIRQLMSGYVEHNDVCVAEVRFPGDRHTKSLFYLKENEDEVLDVIGDNR